MVFLGREISEQRNYSEAVAEKIDGKSKELSGELKARCGNRREKEAITRKNCPDLN